MKRWNKFKFLYGFIMSIIVCGYFFKVSNIYWIWCLSCLYCIVNNVVNCVYLLGYGKFVFDLNVFFYWIFCKL